jgi:hypothetical protein
VLRCCSAAMLLLNKEPISLSTNGLLCFICILNSLYNPMNSTNSSNPINSSNSIATVLPLNKEPTSLSADGLSSLTVRDLTLRTLSSHPTPPSCNRALTYTAVGDILPAKMIRTCPPPSGPRLVSCSPRMCRA